MSHRIERVNRLIRQEISQLLRRQVKDPRLGDFITVTEVDTSADLKYAKVFVSHMGSMEQKQETLDVLATASGFMRRELAKNLRLRNVPELRFQWDNSIERGEHIQRLIDILNPEESSNQ
jgi:ribosome-binding factor A